MAHQLRPSVWPAGPLTDSGVISAFQKSLFERSAKPSNEGAFTVAQAMAAFMAAIEPSDSERSQASKQQQSLRARLEERVVLRATYLSGSYRRHTIKRPLDDIDLLVVLNHEHHEIRCDAAGAKKSLDLVEAALNAAYPKTEKVRHGRCIQIKFAGTGIGFDVVPVVQLVEHEFLMPDEVRGTWVKTNPREVERLVSEANKRCEEWLVPLVKLVKAWKDECAAPLRGFHIEAMVYHGLNAPPTNEREGLAFVFEKMATEVWAPCPDIWPQGENADAALSFADRTKAAGLFASAATEAKRAVAAEAENRTNDAHAIWYSLLGDRYPEAGVPPASVSALSVSDTVKTVTTGSAFSATSAGLIRSSAGFVGVRSASSHGGASEMVEEDLIIPAAQTPAEAQHAYLESEIAQALAQFKDLHRMEAAAAATDPELWPMRRGFMSQPYAVLVGQQGTNYGTRHRILVKVPGDLPATAPRVYLLRQHVERVMTGFGRRGVQSLVPRPHPAPVARWRHVLALAAGSMGRPPRDGPGVRRGLVIPPGAPPQVWPVDWARDRRRRAPPSSR